jgi:hypothetical protein
VHVLFGANNFCRGMGSNMSEDELPIKEIIGFMKVGYCEYGTISLDLINAMTNCLITINVKNDDEFKKALGDGYYK